MRTVIVKFRKRTVILVIFEIAPLECPILKAHRYFADFWKRTVILLIFEIALLFWPIFKSHRVIVAIVKPHRF